MQNNKLVGGVEIAPVTENIKNRPGRPKGKKINWDILTGNDWRYKNNKEIAEMVGTSYVNVFLKRKKLNLLGAAKYTGKAVKRGRPVTAK